MRPGMGLGLGVLERVRSFDCWSIWVVAWIIFRLLLRLGGNTATRGSFSLLLGHSDSWTTRVHDSLRFPLVTRF